MLRRGAGRLVFVRHGESLWNITDKHQNRVTRFTGWANIPMSDVGKQQAAASGRCLNKLGIHFDSIYTSVLERSVQTFELLAKEMKGQTPVPVTHTWRLNERHYGSLVGLSKHDAEKSMGRDKVMHWRRSWDGRPPPMNKHPFYDSFISPEEDGHPPTFLFDWQSEIWSKALIMKRQPLLKKSNDAHVTPSASGSNPYAEKDENIYDGHHVHLLDGLTDNRTEYETFAEIPKSESLADTADRVLPLWSQEILPRIVRGQNVLVVGHSNTIRGMVKHMDRISIDDIQKVTIPSAIPLVYQFELKEKKGNGGSDGDIELVPAGGGRESSEIGMTGRFVVTKELLELTIAARQQFEMSENLDEDGGLEFAGQVQGALQKIKKVSQSRSSGKINRKSVGKEGRKARLNAAAAAQKEEEEEEVAIEMDEGWMNFSVSGKSSISDVPIF